MGGYQSSVPPDEIKTFILSQHHDPTLRDDAITALDESAMSFSLKEKSAFGQLVRWMVTAANVDDDEQVSTSTTELHALIPRLQQAHSYEKQTFCTLQITAPILLQDMVEVVFSLESPFPSLQMRWDLMQIAHEFYNVPEEYVFLFAVKYFGQFHDGIAGHDANWLAMANDNAVLVRKCMRWCLTKNVVHQLVRSKGLARHFLLLIAGFYFTSFLTSTVMQRIYEVTRQNIAHDDGVSSPISLRDLIDASDPVVACFCRHAYPRLKFDGQVEFVESPHSRAAILAISSNMPACVVEAIYPPFSQQDSFKRKLCCHIIIKQAAMFGRLEIMVKYGFDKSYLKYMDLIKYTLRSLLLQCRVDIRDRVCQILELSPARIALAIQQINEDTGSHQRNILLLA